MIEGRWRPGDGRVAVLAFVGEVAQQVIRVGDLIVGVLVAGKACRGRTGILVVDVAFAATDCQMRSRQWEAGLVVIERGW